MQTLYVLTDLEWKSKYLGEMNKHENAGYDPRTEHSYNGNQLI